MRCVVRSRCLPVVASASLRLARFSSTASTSPPAPGGAVLPGVDLARRAVSPSQEFPTTWSDDEPLAPSDPRILWRELYSLEAEKPYYQNVQTMQVQWTIPEGFVTRFPRFYETSGYRVDSTGAVFRTGAATAGETPAPAGAHAAGVKTLSLKQRMAAYGAGGLLWYLIVHSASFIAVFTCLYVFRIDLIGMARSYGFDVKRSSEVAVNENARPPFWKTFVVALVLNKMIVPAHVLVTVTTAPFLVHRLEPIAARLFPAVRTFLQSLVGRGGAAAAAPSAKP